MLGRMRTILVIQLLFLFLLGKVTQSPAQDPLSNNSTNVTDPPTSLPSSSNTTLNCTNPKGLTQKILCASIPTTLPTIELNTTLNCSNPAGSVHAALCNITMNLSSNTTLNCSNPMGPLHAGLCGNLTVPNITTFTNCSRCWNGMTIGNIFDQFRKNFLSGNKSTRSVHQFMNNIRDATRQLLREGPLHRDELWSVSTTLGDSIRYFKAQRYRDRSALESLVDTFNDILDVRNMEGWDEVNKNSSTYTDQMLQYAEDCGQYMGLFLDNTTASVLISRANIVFKADMISRGEEGYSSFPNDEDLVNSTANSDDSSGLNGRIKIPASLLQKVTTQSGGDAQVIHILMNSIQDFLPTSDVNQQRPASVVISSQVVNSNSTLISTSDVLETTPVEILFELNENATSEDNATPVCVSWKYGDNSSVSGQWVSDGIRTIQTGDNSVRCESTHLTSFSVLVDFTGNTTSSLALSIVSYIGCAVSLACLLVTVIFLLTLGKTLFSEVHNFSHLNLSLALLLGLIVFVAGIETAVVNEIACRVVAFMLHYFFLAAFCWMLCEGIMLYFMIVVVFSKMIKRWWFYLILGWGLPVIPPVVTLGVKFDNYTTTQNFCWLGSYHGIIWSFIGPMLLIVAINFVIMVIVIVQLGRTQWKRKSHKLQKGKFSRQTGVAGDLIQGLIILLPLLGLTWVFGLFAVDENTVVFAWLFTIFNSLQGFFIFFFHVVRSKRVWGRFKKWYQRKRGLTVSTGTSTMRKHLTSISSTSTMRSSISSVSSYHRNHTQNYISTSELEAVSEMPEITNETRNIEE